MPEYTPPAGSSGDASPLTTKGDLYGYDTDNNRIPIGTNGQVLTADSAQALGLKWASPGAAVTLDQAYDQGGPGVGRAIDADSGAVQISVSNPDNNKALEIVQNDTTNNPVGVSIENTGTGAGLDITQASGGNALLIRDDGVTPNPPIIALKSMTTVSIISAGNTGTVNITPGTGADQKVEVVGGGLTVGSCITAPVNDGFSVGTNNVVDNGAAIGQSCVSSNQSLAIGNAADTVTGYSADTVLVLAGDSNVGGSYSANSVVLDAANQSAGPVGGGATAVPPTVAGIGNVYLDTGGYFTGSADYAEMFEWDDGNVNSADRRGFFVSLVNGNKIEIGNSDVIGVVSARPAVIGDAAELGWQGQYVTDEFGTPLYDRVEGKMVPRVNPNFDATQRYTPRRTRKEWGTIGLLGKLYVRSAQILNAGNRCSANSTGYAVSGNDYRILRVIRQATATQYGIIEILMK